VASLHLSAMTNEPVSQLDSNNPTESPLVQFDYPELRIKPTFTDLLTHSHPADMSDLTSSDHPDHPDKPLSESWATLSEAEYSADDDLHSETTDAPSLVGTSGPEDVHSISDHTSDAGSQDAQSDKGLSEDLPAPGKLADDEATPSASAIASSRFHSKPPIVFDVPKDQTEADVVKVKQVIHSFDQGKTSENTGRTVFGRPAEAFGSVCMTMSRDRLSLGRPVRLLYIGEPSARPEILAKLGEALMAGLGQKQNQQQLDLSRYHVQASTSDSAVEPNFADLIPIKTQMIVDDCTTAAAIKHEDGPDQIFLSFKNGSLYSSRWNGTAFEVSSASEWSSPDLAIFFVSQDDHAVLRQRHKLASTFISRHNIPSLVISEEMKWVSRIDDLQINPHSPHLQMEAETTTEPRGRLLIQCFPIDIETFESLASDQLGSQYFNVEVSQKLCQEWQQLRSFEANSQKDESHFTHFLIRVE
jgi:hypothetical protein